MLVHLRLHQLHQHSSETFWHRAEGELGQRGE